MLGSQTHLKNPGLYTDIWNPIKKSNYGRISFFFPIEMIGYFLNYRYYFNSGSSSLNCHLKQTYSSENDWKRKLIIHLNYLAVATGWLMLFISTAMFGECKLQLRMPGLDTLVKAWTYWLLQTGCLPSLFIGKQC